MSTLYSIMLPRYKTHDHGPFSLECFIMKAWKGDFTRKFHAKIYHVRKYLQSNVEGGQCC